MLTQLFSTEKFIATNITNYIQSSKSGHLQTCELVKLLRPQILSGVPQDVLYEHDG